jgi:serine/threonine-protein kinase
MGEAVASPGVPRDILVDSSEDLLAVLAAAGPRSTIVLTDDGPYKLGHADRRPTVDRLVRRDLTIKADVGVRPILRFARESASGAKPRSALLEFVGGHITLEGIVFVLEPGEGVESLTAVRAEDAETTFRRCIFRRQGSSTGAARCIALQLRSWTTPTADGDRPLATTLDQCHFGTGQTGVLASGPLDLAVRDCTFAASESAFWLDNGKSSTAVPADFRLKHISVLAGDGPVFRFEGTDARVWLEDSVVAAAESDATLVACDLPDSLVWRGRSNLYSRVGTFLQPSGGRPGREPTHDPLKWQETVDEIRESGSVFTSMAIWDESAAGRAQALDSSTPTRAFRLASGHAGRSDVGARRGPSGVLYPAIRPNTIARSGASANEGARDRKPADTVSQEDSRPPVGAVVPPPAGEPTSAVVSTRISEVPDMPVMPPAGRDKPAVAANDPDETHPAETPVVVEPATPPSVPHIRGDARAEVAILRTVDQFMSALNDPAARGGLLRVDAGADWVLTGTQVRVAGTWRVQAEPGHSRPRLRFLPDPADARAPGAWSAMLELRSGSLQFEGFDIILPKTHAPPAGQGRWAAFHLAAATDLSLTDCTVTVEGDQPSSAIVAVSAADSENSARPGGEPPTATVRLFDCLLRAGGDLIDVAADRRLVLELNNAVVSTGGALVHAHGLPRGQTSEKASLTIRQVTARNAGGLVHLESAPGEPELPIAEVNARDSILVTDSSDTPLLRIDGQDTPAMRDRIEWEGHGVAYAQINTYRRDQSAQVGVVPTLYDRRDWTVWVGSKESTPFHGDARFKREWDPERSPWSFVRDDARLANDSPVLSAGADLERIPNAPPG